MKHAVRSTLATLVAGVVVQRVLQLAAFLCIGRALGPERLGVFASGLATAALLSIVAGAGVRNLLARAVTRAPDAARELVLRAVRVRLVAGIAIAGPAVAIAFAATDQPWFWTLCVLHVVPAAFELKNLLDAAGRTRSEVVLETTASVLQLVLVVAWMLRGGDDLAALAGIALVSRCAYALLAIPAIARLPRRASRDGAVVPSRTPFAVVAGQTASELVAAGDVWLVVACFGTGAAGLYSVATRFAAAALLPSAQLARLLLPHLLHASANGDPARTLRTAARATAMVTLPMLAGGAAVAERLCALPGAPFAVAAPALILALVAGCLQHAAWQRSHALLAAGRDRLYAMSLAVPALIQVVALLAAGRVANGADDAFATALAAGVGAFAQLVYFVWTVRAAHRSVTPEPSARTLMAAGLALATGLAAAAPRLVTDGPLLLPLQLASGGCAFAIGLWFVELRGRLGRVGDQLASASGFRS